MKRQVSRGNIRRRMEGWNHGMERQKRRRKGRNMGGKKMRGRTFRPSLIPAGSLNDSLQQSSGRLIPIPKGIHISLWFDVTGDGDTVQTTSGRRCSLVPCG